MTDLVTPPDKSLVSPRPVVKIEIVLEAGNVSMTGPIQDKILCLGLLDMAKQIVLTYGTQPSQNGKHGFLKKMGILK